jgi:hypothetical protein
VSCQKGAIAQTVPNYTLPAASASALGGVLVGDGLSVTFSGLLSVAASSTQLNLLVYYKSIRSTIAIWTAKYDGTNQTKINVTLPAIRNLQMT